MTDRDVLDDQPITTKELFAAIGAVIDAADQEAPGTASAMRKALDRMKTNNGIFNACYRSLTTPQVIIAAALGGGSVKRVA